MKILNSFFWIFMLLLMYSCDEKAETFASDIEWTESQVLCVYWAANYKHRDTLPAINFQIKFRNLESIIENSFYFDFQLEDNDLKKVKLDIILSNDQNQKLAGLLLRAGELYNFFAENFSLPDAPCYEKRLANLLGSGNLIMVENGRDKKVGKSKDFKFFIGLKD